MDRPTLGGCDLELVAQGRADLSLVRLDNTGRAGTLAGAHARTLVHGVVARVSRMGGVRRGRRRAQADGDHVVRVWTRM